MNYETATNIELNFELARKLNLRPYKNPEEGGDAVMVTADHGFYKWIDYCTDWNATMPLAVEHGVYYYPSKNGYEGRVVTKQDRNGHYYNQKSNEDNPLRAIVICLIKVLESKQ